MTDGFMRLFDEGPPDWPLAVVALIDALRDYVRCNEGIDADAKSEGWDISEETWAKHELHMKTVRALLTELETYEVGTPIDKD